MMMMMVKMVKMINKYMVGLGLIVYSPLLEKNTYSTRVDNKQLWKIVLKMTPPWLKCNSSIIILYQFLPPPHPSLPPSPQLTNHATKKKRYQLEACMFSIYYDGATKICPKYVFLALFQNLLLSKTPS